MPNLLFNYIKKEKRKKLKDLMPSVHGDTFKKALSVEQEVAHLCKRKH